MSGVAIDTNVVLYSWRSNDRKAQLARELIRPGTTISVQVLNETASVLTGKYKVSWDDTAEFLHLVRSAVRVMPLNESIHELGVSIAARYRVHIYDALILASALAAQCDTLYSEDMHAGLVIENRLRIVNPFA